MRSSINNVRLHLIGVIIVVLSSFVINQLQTGVFSAGRESSNSPETSPPLSIMAVLTVPGNQAISVNGAKAISGGTILSGATIATTNQVKAIVAITPLATLEIAPAAILKAEFDQNGNVRVNLAQGCTMLRTRKGATGEVVTARGLAGKTDANEGGFLEVCFPQGAWPGPGIERNEGRGLFHLAGIAASAVIVGGVRSNMAVGLDDRGSNPGPSMP